MSYIRTEISLDEIVHGLSMLPYSDIIEIKYFILQKLLQFL